MVKKDEPHSILHPADIEKFRKPSWGSVTLMAKDQEVGLLLRKLASALDDLGDVYVGDVIVARELGLEGYEFRGTLYFQAINDSPEAGTE